MTVQEKLVLEFEAAIVAVLGDESEKEYDEEKHVFDKETLLAIARKVNFYLND